MNQLKQLWRQHRDELGQMEREYQVQRDKLLFAIERLEKAMSEATPKRRGRGKNGQSIADLAEKVLDPRPEGLYLPGLLAELKKLGYETESKNAANTVNSILNREKDRFVRVEDRWILKKHQAMAQATEETAGKIARIAAEADQKKPSVAFLDLSKLPLFLMKILADVKEQSTEELAKAAVARGWKFGQKNPNRVVHFGLLNAVKRGYVEFRNGVWRNSPVLAGQLEALNERDLIAHHRLN